MESRTIHEVLFHSIRGWMTPTFFYGLIDGEISKGCTEGYIDTDRHIDVETLGTLSFEL